MTDHEPDAADRPDDTATEAEQEHDRIAAGRDPETSREAFEVEMAEEGRSEEAGEVGDRLR